MSETPKTEALPTQEAMAVRELDATANRILSEYEGTLAYPNPHASNPDGNITKIALSESSGATLEQTVSPDGSVAYKHTRLWHSTGDRGSFYSSWQQGSEVLTKGSRSEMNGDSPETSGDVADMAAAEEALRTDFPSKERISSNKPSKMRRLLGKIGLRKVITS